MRRVAAAMLGVALALAGACGGDSDDGDDGAATATTAAADAGKGSGHEVDACDLLTSAEVAAAFGSPFGEGEAGSTASSPLGGSQCTWTNTDAPPVKTFTVSVLSDDTMSEALRKAGRTVAQQYADSEALVKSQEGYESVAGLGDKAYRSKTRLVVLKGDAQVSFTTLFGDSDVAITGMKTLAAKAVARVD